MMKNSNIYIINSCLLISLLIFSLSCKNQQSKYIYYYAELFKEEITPDTYYATIITEEKNIRKIRYYVFSVYSNTIVDSLTEYYKFEDEEIYKLRKKDDIKGEPFLSTKTDTCIVYNHSDKLLNEVLSTKHCFIGKEKIKLGQNKELIESYVFLRTVGLNESVDS